MYVAVNGSELHGNAERSLPIITAIEHIPKWFSTILYLSARVRANVESSQLKSLINMNFTHCEFIIHYIHQSFSFFIAITKLQFMLKKNGK